MPQASASSTLVRAPPPTRTATTRRAGRLEHAPDIRDESADFDRGVGGGRRRAERRPTRPDDDAPRRGAALRSAATPPRRTIAPRDVRAVVPRAIEKNVVDAAAARRAAGARPDPDGNDAHDPLTVERLQEPPVAPPGTSIRSNAPKPPPPAAEPGRLAHMNERAPAHDPRHGLVIGPVHLLAIDHPRTGRRSSTASSRLPRRGRSRRAAPTARERVGERRGPEVRDGVGRTGRLVLSSSSGRPGPVGAMTSQVTCAADGSASGPRASARSPSPGSPTANTCTSAKRASARIRPEVPMIAPVHRWNGTFGTEEEPHSPGARPREDLRVRLALRPPTVRAAANRSAPPRARRVTGRRRRTAYRRPRRPRRRRGAGGLARLRR